MSPHREPPDQYYHVNRINTIINVCRYVHYFSISRCILIIVYVCVYVYVHIHIVGLIRDTQRRYGHWVKTITGYQYINPLPPVSHGRWRDM